MTQCKRYHGGLVFFDILTRDLDVFGRVVASTLGDYGYPVEHQSVLPDGQMRITSGQVLVCVQADPDQPRLVLTLQPEGPAAVAPEQAQLLLLVMLYRIIEACPARDVEWLDPGTRLPAGQFVGAVTRVSPRRVRSRQEVMDEPDTPFGPVEDNAQAIATRYDEIQAEPGTHRADETEALARAFRLNTQVLALTGFLAAATSGGSLNQVVGSLI